jgi:hypothetical protein
MTQGNNRAPDPLQQEFNFDKFVRDIERREDARREQAERAQENDHNARTRERVAREREHAHNRIRWRR